MVMERGKATNDPAITYHLAEFYCFVVCLNLKRVPRVLWQKILISKLIVMGITGWMLDSDF